MENAQYSEAYLAESQQPFLIPLFTIPIILITISTGLRLWVKVTKTKLGRFVFDDYLMIFSAAMCITLCIYNMYPLMPAGLGRHIARLEPPEIERFIMLTFLAGHWYYLSIAATKLSVLALLWRIFETPGFRKVVIGTSVIVSAWMITLEVVSLCTCRPLETAWKNPNDHTKCIYQVRWSFFVSISNMIFDLWIFSMPIPTIIKLQALKERRKVLLFLFSFGLGTCLLSATRLGMFIAYLDDFDPCWTLAPISAVSSWEACGGILCANLPVVYTSVKETCKRYGGSLFTTSEATSNRISRPTGADSRLHPDGHGDWTRLPNLQDLNHQISAVASSVPKGEVELRALRPDGIIVTKKFVSVEEGIPLPPPNKADPGTPRQSSRGTDGSTSWVIKEENAK